jgi:hypothetical protein
MIKINNVKFKHVRQSEEDTSKSPETPPNSTSTSTTRNGKNLHRLKRCLKIGFVVIALLIITGIGYTIYKYYRALEQKRWRETVTLESLCESTKWQEAVYLNCTNLEKNSTTTILRNMGVSNLRNTLVTCLRLAIDGGMGLIMPKIARRSDNNISDFSDWTDISFLFDIDNFKQQLGQKCPLLKLYDTDYPVENRVVVERYLAKEFYTPGTYRSYIDDLLESENINKPVVIWEKEILFCWDFRYDGESIRNSLIDIVRYPSHLINISKTIANGIKGKYAGLHLRAESDAPWQDYKAQVDWFLRTLHTNYSSIDKVYVAVGSEELVKQFVVDMAKNGISVISKWSYLVNDNDLQAQINKLHFDQLAVIDYQVLLHSDYFFGLSLSSFAYSIAYDRGGGNIQNCKCHLLGRKEWLFECCF